jgi:hypothetical protein
MIDLDPEEVEPVVSPPRDGVEGLEAADPTVVSISDVHGYLGAARSALKTVGDYEGFDPLVTTDDEGCLHWAGSDEYVLVFNGDLIDRGPDNEGVIDLVERLIEEAPPGHVRITLGNHEWGALFPAVVGWEQWYSGQLDDDGRRQLCSVIADGHVVAAYDGYNFTYAHAGLPSSYESQRLNNRLVEAARTLADAVGTDEDADTQRELVSEYRQVLSLGRQNGRGFGAGIAWLDFNYMPDTAPPQIVGHTRQEQPVQKGNVICENVIRKNRGNPGGEAVLVETPDELRSLERVYDGGVYTHEFEIPDDEV